MVKTKKNKQMNKLVDVVILVEPQRVSCTYAKLIHFFSLSGHNFPVSLIS